MIEMIDIGIDNAVAFKVAEKISEEDMNLVLSAAKKAGEAHGDIVIYEVIESFEGVEIKSLVEKIKYLFEVGISNIRKIAVVTDKQWMQKAVSIEDKIFRNIDMQAFAFEDQDDAIAFLKD